jgi:hypothetical protein
VAYFDEDVFWKSKTATNVYDFATQYERLNTYTDAQKMGLVLATNNGAIDLSGTMSLSDFLNIRRESAWSEDVARFPGTIDEQKEMANELGILSDEETAIFTNITNQEAPKKNLELYFNAYMAPAQSDIKWRLGEVTGYYMPTDDPEGTRGLINPDGSIYFRSNFNQSLQTEFWNGVQGKTISSQGIYYASMFFPPYKMGTDYDLTDKTDLMKDPVNPDGWTFNKDNFTVKREGYTYREPGFKPVNDNINFLQWCMERATGIVSTYLTEWDLSVYMQEHMLSIDPNGGPTKLWLNYRVRQDNPLATVKKGYTGDRALCFSVLNSAVSKIDFDNLKYWRPSDHPYSPYWMPYVKDYDWMIKWAEIHNDDLGDEVDPEKIPYMSVYDESPVFSYNKKTTKQIIKHQDYMQISLSQWKGMDMQYYQVLYSIESEALTEYDLKLKKYLDKTAGADYGKLGAYDLSHMKAESWSNMLANGGYVGADGPAGFDGCGGAASAKSKKAQFLKWMIFGGDNGATDGSDEVQQLNQALSGVNGDSIAADMLSGPLTGTGPGGKVTSADVAEAKRKQASTMGKYTGINRMSPALYGGPHGSSYSPLTIQGFFDVDNKALRNTPRISPSTANDFTSEFKFELYDGNNRFYYNSTPNSCSPSKSISFLKNGKYVWVPSFALFKVSVTKLVKGTIKYSPWGKVCTATFPNLIEGQGVSYSGGVVYISKTEWQPDNLWNLASGNWWNNYYSYFNDFAIRKRVRQAGQWGYLTTFFEAFKMGTYFTYVSRSYKKYLLHDEPDVKWSITTHKCLKYKTEGAWSSPYWKMLRGLFSRVNIRTKYIMYVSQDVLFKLNIDDPAAEARVRDYMIAGGRGLNAKVPLFFLQGNLPGRYDQGPESIFQANCKVEYYTTEKQVAYSKIVWNWNKTGSFWFSGRWVPSVVTDYRTVYENVPYIAVELNDIDLLFWADKLSTRPYTNRHKGSAEVPLQFQSVPTVSEAVTADDDPLVKFKGGFNYKFFSGREEDFTETISRYIVMIASGNNSPPVPDYPNPDNLYPRPRVRTGMSKIPATMVYGDDGPDYPAKSVTPRPSPWKYETNKYAYDETKKRDPNCVPDEPLVELVNAANPNATVPPSNRGAYQEGDWDIETHFLHFPVDKEKYGDKAGKAILLDGVPIPWYMEVVYERRENCDIWFREADTSHLSIEAEGLQVTPTDVTGKAASSLFTQSYIDGPGTIISSKKFYAIQVSDVFFDQLYEGEIMEHNLTYILAPADVDAYTLPRGPKYEIEYYPHFKSYENVSREKGYQDPSQISANAALGISLLQADGTQLGPYEDVYNLPSDLWTGEQKTLGVYDWRSIGTAGIKGIGILSKLPGLSPVVEDTEFENFSSLLSLNSALYERTPMESIPWKTHKVVKVNAKVEKTVDGVEWIQPGGSFEYRSFDMDEGLKRALSTLATRATFFRIDSPTVPMMVDLSVPFRVLLNVCLSQRSFIKLLKEVLLDNVDFATMYQIIDECVDKVASKANGFYVPDDPTEEARADPAHLLYNYWLEQIIKILVDKTKHNTFRAKVESDFSVKLTKLDLAIDVLAPMSETWAREWTWSQLMKAYEILQMLQSMADENTYVEKYIMGYLHVLYYYRLFFICKRFNKQDGTMWVMRALESILNFVSPYGSDDNPPPSPMKLMQKDPAYKVAFVEFQNTFDQKKGAVVTEEPIGEDRVRVCYVKVEWTTKKAYEAYLNWKELPTEYPEVPEVVEVYHGGKKKYARKPIDGTYSLISKEILERDRDVKWNNVHPQDKPRVIPDYDVATWWITWGDGRAEISPETGKPQSTQNCTPIRWNVFVSLNPDKLMTYIDSSISPEELVCMAEMGADFWTVYVPESIWPRARGLKTQVKLKHYDPPVAKTSLKGDPYVAILGSQSYGLWPITEKQDAPNPSIGLDPGQKDDFKSAMSSYV